MPKVEQIICDRCGAVKKQQNNWWLLCRWPKWALLLVLNAEQDGFTHPDPPDAKLYLCGEACVSSIFSGFMASVQGASVIPEE